MNKHCVNTHKLVGKNGGRDDKKMKLNFLDLVLFREIGMTNHSILSCTRCRYRCLVQGDGCLLHGELIWSILWRDAKELAQFFYFEPT